MADIVNITPNLRPTFAWQSGNIWQDAKARAAILARFWTFVNRAKAKGEDCWNWTGYVAGDSGYGVFAVCHAGRRHGVMRAHRLVWLLTHGDIPEGFVVCHNCDNPRCVNPSHLRLDSQGGNIRESVRKGRKKAWGLQKLNAEQVQAIRQTYAAGGTTQKALAGMFGIARNTVSQIVNRTTWGHLPDAPAAIDQVSRVAV